MRKSADSAALALDNAEVLAALQKARDAVAPSLAALSAMREGIAKLGKTFATLPGVEALNRRPQLTTSDTLETADASSAFNENRQINSSVDQARLANPQGENVIGVIKGHQAHSENIANTAKDKKTASSRMNPFDHFKTPDTDRFAKVGLFISGAPQTPGLSEARRTAQATEESCKLLKQVLLKTDRGVIEPAIYAE